MNRRGIGAPLARFTVALLASVALLPGAAQAHGPTAPVASDYLAVVDQVPPGLDAKVVDGDLRIWLSAPSNLAVVVLDYRGAPYLRLRPSGVEVNHNSAMYYLNQTPLAQTPPLDLSRATPPAWEPVSSAHDYSWHDARLGALSTIAIPPGTRYVGRWSIPLVIDGRPASISGSVWYAPRPSIIWFWSIVVLLACVVAAWRVRRPSLDAGLARGLGATSLVAFALGGVGHDLHGRPNVSTVQLVELALIAAFVVWGLHRVLVGRPGYFTYFVIAFVTLWEGVSLFPTLRHGFVLLALPADIARTVTVLCFAAGAGTALLVFRLSEQSAARAGGARFRSARAQRRRERSVPG